MKPLKILIGNNTLSFLGGSETFTRTLALGLRKLGHDVACFSPELGLISDQLAEKGVRSFPEITTATSSKFTPYFNEPVDHTYDVIIASHFHIVAYLREKFPKTPIINICHGIIHALPDGSWAPEHPATESGVNQFVVVSEELQGILAQQYSIDAKIVRNALDTPKLSSLRPARSKPEQFLVNTNYMGRDDKAIKTIKEAAHRMGAKLAAVGMNFSPTTDVTAAIEESDVVFGMGRSVLEGVAAGRLGICYGRWGTGGPIIESTVEEIRHFNFSGRNAKDGRMATADELVAMIEKYYMPATLEWGKSYTAREHNVALSTEEYVRMARELTGQIINAPTPNLAVDPAAKKLKLAF